MELGALVCTARAPRCEVCPIRSECAWERAGAPPDAGPARRGQAWVGTDRQARGALLPAPRDAPATVRPLTREGVGPDPIHPAPRLDRPVPAGPAGRGAGQSGG